MRCPECGRELDGLMVSDPSKPGLGGLLHGEGEDRGLVAIAWVFVLLVIFACAWGLFAVSSLVP
jgi:hypothetical protein